MCKSPCQSGEKKLNTLIFLRSKEFLEDKKVGSKRFCKEKTLFAGSGNYLCYKDYEKNEVSVINLE